MWQMKCKSCDVIKSLSNFWKTAIKMWLWSVDKQVNKSMYGVVDRLKYGLPMSEERLEFTVLDHCTDSD